MLPRIANAIRDLIKPIPSSSSSGVRSSPQDQRQGKQGSKDGKRRGGQGSESYSGGRGSAGTGTQSSDSGGGSVHQSTAGPPDTADHQERSSDGPESGAGVGPPSSLSGPFAPPGQPGASGAQPSENLGSPEGQPSEEQRRQTSPQLDQIEPGKPSNVLPFARFVNRGKKTDLGATPESGTPKNKVDGRSPDTPSATGSSDRAQELSWGKDAAASGPPARAPAPPTSGNLGLAFVQMLNLVQKSKELFKRGSSRRNYEAQQKQSGDNQGAQSAQHSSKGRLFDKVAE